MKAPAYPKYKASGVEWLGDIPAHWNLKRLRFVADRSDEKVEVDEDNPIQYVGMEHVESWTGKLLQLDTELVPSGVSNRFQRGDVLFGKLRPYLAKACIPYFNGLCSSELLVLRARGHDRRYLLYQLLSEGFVSLVDSSTYGAKMPRASWDFIGACTLPCPDVDEQRAIADFLDAETAELNTLIAKKRELIEKLKEKRTALISRTVTRGLPPEAARAASLNSHPKLKPSGIEWLGDIPEHWKVVRFGRCAFFQEGPGLRNWQFMDTGVRVICVTNITDSGIDFFSYEKFISEEEYLETYRHFTVMKGDLLLSSSGNSWGKVAEFQSDEPSILNTSTIRINCNRARTFSRSFLKWLLQADSTRKQLGVFMTGSCQPNFGPSHLARVLVPLPSPDEQSAIADYLDQETAKIDRMVEKVETAIERLQEYRTALINAAVTGKIDVRAKH